VEGIAPTLQLCLEVRLALECGRSTSEALRTISPGLDFEIRQEVTQLLLNMARGDQQVVQKIKMKSPYRQSLFVVLYSGLIGEPIVARLKELEQEIQSACEEEIELFISKLPMRILLPMLLIQFPAFLLLMFGPLLDEFIKGVLK
jgi:hypothetical protein